MGRNAGWERHVWNEKKGDPTFDRAVQDCTPTSSACPNMHMHCTLDHPRNFENGNLFTIIQNEGSEAAGAAG